MAQNYQLPTTVNPPTFSGFGNSSGVYPSNITTYGAIVLPFDVDDVLKKSTVQNNAKATNSFKGKLRSALNLSPNKNLLGASIMHPGKTLGTLAKYMYDNRSEISGLMNTIGSKFSGIAVTQALINGKVTSKEALDYLFMGFAPALGVQGSLMGYSGLNQMKDALFNGSINVGAFVSGFSRTLKGATDLKDMLTKKQARVPSNVIEFDLTVSHSETYQAETPDRRVQSGQSLNEYIHNMPETFEVQCALQEGKRYSKAEFRAVLQSLRTQKMSVSLILGEEMFDNLILTNFSPSHNCSKSGMDYTLSFKKVYRNDIDTHTIVNIQSKPVLLEIEEGSTTIGGLTSSVGGASSSGDLKLPPLDDINPLSDVKKVVSKTLNFKNYGSSIAVAIMEGGKK